MALTSRISSAALPPLAAGLAAYALASAAGDGEAAYLALPLTGSLLATAALSRRWGRVGAVLATLSLWVPPPGPERGTLVTAGLALWLGLAAAEWLRRHRRLGRRGLPLGFTVPVAVGLQLLAQSEHLLTLAWPGALGRFVALPLLAALAVTAAGHRWGTAPPLIAACAAAVAGPGWTPWTTGLLVAVAIAALFVPLPEIARRPARWALPMAAGALAWVTVAAAFPWFTGGKASMAGLAAGSWLPPPVAADPRSPVALTAADPEWRLDLTAEASRRETARLLVDSHLAFTLGLAADTPVAEVRLLDEDDTVLHREPLTLGDDTGEWATGRADLAGAPAPEAWVSWVPPDGGFFAHRYRARFDLPSPVAARAVVIARAPGLPEEAVVVIHRLELTP